MKIVKTILIFLGITILSNILVGQDIKSDTTIANQYFEKAEVLFNNNKFDSAASYYIRSAALYQSCEKYLDYIESSRKVSSSYNNLSRYIESKENLLSALNYSKKFVSDSNVIFARAYNTLGQIYTQLSLFDSSLYFYNKSLNLKRNILGENNISTAKTINNIANVYHYNNDLREALENFEIANKIFESLLGANHNYTAITLVNIARIYISQSQYKQAINNFNKANKIFVQNLGENNAYSAYVFENIAGAYYELGEFDLAKDYYQKSLLTYKKIYQEPNEKIGIVYFGFANIDLAKQNYEYAIKNYKKALYNYKGVFHESHYLVATVYNNIGLVHYETGNQDSAIWYFNKALNINKDIFGETSHFVARTYGNLGLSYNEIDLDKAIEYYKKAIDIYTKCYGSKHPDIALFNFNLGTVYASLNNPEIELEYLNKALLANLKGYYGFDYKITPKIENYLNWEYLLRTLQYIAETIFFNSDKTPYKNQLNLSLKYYLDCDTLINQVRQEIITKSDKIALGEKATEVYQGAIEVCKKLVEESSQDKKHYYKELAFYFSELNKSSVLLEALAGAEAQKFSGIPDSLLQQEHNLSIDIALYKKLLAEQIDSAQEIKFRDKLFVANRQYDQLIATFETDYPSYFELKYNQKPAGIKDIQNILDDNTAMISYFTGDSLITIFTITKNDLHINTTTKIENFADSIKYYRYGLIYTSSSRFAEMYKNRAYQFYKNLIPENNDNIKNLIIIPDAELSMIPFETLLTEEVGDKEWKDLPYLIKKYNVSYSYSANLFYKTFPKEPASKIETTDLNDWLAFAPVFDDSNTAGLTLRTRELLGQSNSEMDDTLGTRGRLIDGGYISPLPGTESEVKAIFKEFDDKGKKAKVQIKNSANEEFIKSGDLSKYKFLHFATHGFVNTEKPELSGIFLAQDSTSNEDGILYQGEIYNLDLNADLTVLSACETGLGQIKKGEGLIGLTRALLYAGSKNIIVSLWSVADESTSDLMINFYKNLLEENQQKMEFSKALRQSKLAMIDQGKFAHPFYWSPFILIGK